MHTQFVIKGGTALAPEGSDHDSDWNEADVVLRGTGIERLGMYAGGGHTVFDAAGLLVLPGIVDIHGDAFERQIQPRPQTVFSHAIALADTDRQLVSNGITTACHGVSYSWEGGLRGRAAALSLMEQIAAQRATLQADHRFHLRFETHHVDGLMDALAWIEEGLVGFLAFNEHLPAIAAKSAQPGKLATYAERARCDAETFRQRLQQAQQCSAQVPQVVEALATACRRHNIPMASHDDRSGHAREFYQELGVEISEFPRTQDALFTAMALGNRVIMGAPNVLLGGSHSGGLATADAVKSGMCDILASDYYYPSLLHAPFKLVQLGACTLAQAWRLVSVNPAAALGLHDRGQIAPGYRADLALVEPDCAGGVRLVATIAGGRLTYCAEHERLQRTLRRQVFSLAA